LNPQTVRQPAVVHSKCIHSDMQAIENQGVSMTH
jgi:hypothetical protein